MSLGQISARYTLELILDMAGENLSFELWNDCIHVAQGVQLHITPEEQTVFEIESTRWICSIQKKEDAYLAGLRKTKPHLFDWLGKNGLQATEEIASAFTLNVTYESLPYEAIAKGRLMNRDAPQKRWHANAYDALQAVTKHTDTYLDVHLLSDEPSFQIMIRPSQDDGLPPQDWEKELKDFIRQRTELYETRLGKAITDEPVWKLRAFIEKLTQIKTVMDRTTWESGIVVSLQDKNASVKELLDYLRASHGIMHRFRSGKEEEAGVLYLSKPD